VRDQTRQPNAREQPAVFYGLSLHAQNLILQISNLLSPISNPCPSGFKT
jgi:hypothetical protein